MDNEEDAIANLAKYLVTPEHKETIANRKQVVLLLVELRDVDVNKTNILISRVIERIHNGQGTVYNVVGGIVMATFDRAFQDFADASRQCETTAMSLGKVFGEEGRVVYGIRPGKYHVFGTRTNQRNVIFLPQVGDLILQLRKIAFGTVRKLESLSSGL